MNVKILLVEEAAQVLESRCISILNRSIEHLIMIGDHHQLKPSVNNTAMREKYNLEMSLFERLIGNNQDIKRLNIQRRMRPEISKFLKAFYDFKIFDNEEVLKREKVKGIDKDIYFLNLRDKYHEQQNQISKSYQNLGEAKICAKLALYITQQNQFKVSQITILTLYRLQKNTLRRICKETSKTLIPDVDQENPEIKRDSVKIETVDNYQGQENEIIILSLVRSNKETKTGFMKIKNRINVALSRARCGMFVVGNLDMIMGDKFGGPDPFWPKIFEICKENDFLSEAIVLRCQKHPDQLNKIAAAEDFEKNKNGGCNYKCTEKMSCGHDCKSECHHLESYHDKENCTSLCGRICQTCKSSCQYKCVDCTDMECKPCNFKVNKELPCGHYQKIKCSQDPSEVECMEYVDITLKCGHRVTNSKCSETKNLIGRLSKCNEICDKKLQCGHLCSQKCSECLNGELHRPCTQKEQCQLCEKQKTCGQLCQNKVDVECLHGYIHNGSIKDKKVECYKFHFCDESCPMSCKHQTCVRKCYEKQCQIQNRCQQRCEKQLQCGHPCLGVCNEVCPNLCFECQIGDEQILQKYKPQFEEQKAALAGQRSIRNRNLDFPIFISLQNCGCTFELVEIDQSDKIEECPKCKNYIFNKRYHKEFILSQYSSDYGKKIAIILERKKRQDDYLLDKKILPEIKLEDEKLEGFLKLMIDVMNQKENQEVYNLYQYGRQVDQLVEIVNNFQFFLHYKGLVETVKRYSEKESQQIVRIINYYLSGIEKYFKNKVTNKYLLNDSNFKQLNLIFENLENLIRASYFTIQDQQYPQIPEIVSLIQSSQLAECHENKERFKYIEEYYNNELNRKNNERQIQIDRNNQN